MTGKYEKEVLRQIGLAKSKGFSDKQIFDFLKQRNFKVRKYKK